MRFYSTSSALSKPPLLAFHGSETSLSRRQHSSFCVLMTIGGSVQFGLAMGSDVRSEAQSHRRPNDKDRIAEGRQSESARQAVYSKRCYTVEPTVQHWSIDQTGRVPFPPIYLIPILPELSCNISLKTSRNPGTFRTLLDYSGSF